MLLRPLLAAAALTLLGGACVATSAPADSVTANVVTPGAFHGYGFDQCLAPSQQAMNAWLRQSPYLAVGIYISGASRACRVQPNLTPTWVTTQLRNGWKLLPITLGPQASQLHKLAFTRQRGHRETVAHCLSPAGQVGLDVIDPLRTMCRPTEPRDYFVNDQQRAVPVAQPPNTLEVAGFWFRG